MITVLSLLRGLLLTTFHLKYGKSLLSNIPLRKGDYASYALRSTTIPLDLEVMQQAVYQAPTAKDSSVVIIGGGPAGLASAIMLARRGYKKIKVYDRLLEPPAPDDSSVWNDFENSRSYNIGVNGRGQKALAELEVLSKIDSYSAKCVGRMEWSPEGTGEPKETINNDAGRAIRIL